MLGVLGSVSAGWNFLPRFWMQHRMIALVFSATHGGVRTSMLEGLLACLLASMFLDEFHHDLLLNLCLTKISIRGHVTCSSGLDLQVWGQNFKSGSSSR